jgi:hypothetical protein
MKFLSDAYDFILFIFRIVLYRIRLVKVGFRFEPAQAGYPSGSR